MRRPVLLLLALALVAAGCGGVDLRFGGLDVGPLEAEIEADIEAGADGIDIDRVECPGGVRPEQGDVFVCRVHAVDGSLGTVEVTQVDDQGSVEWRVTDVRAPSSATPTEG